MPKRSRWSHSEGSYGYTVTVAERTAGGRLSLRWWDPVMRNWRWRALGHTDRETGIAQAKELSGQLLAEVAAPARHEVPLAGLFARYERDVSIYKKGRQRAEDRRRMALWQSVLGPARDARTIDAASLLRFIQSRRAGALSIEGLDLQARVTEGTIGADIVFLQSVLNWATSVTLPDSGRLLADNPVRGFERPRTKTPRRPLASYDRFVKLRKVADRADRQRLFGAFLDLIESLGWRVSAICQLVAADVDRRRSKNLPHGRLRKRGANDKETVEMRVPLSAPARKAIDQVLARNPTIGERPLFPSPRKAARPWTRWHARDLLERAERLAKLEPLEGSDFHAYRRKWVTERKHLPDADVMAAGGWTDPRSLKQAYQHVDDKTLLAVVSETRKLREAK